MVRAAVLVTTLPRFARHAIARDPTRWKRPHRRPRVRRELIGEPEPAEHQDWAETFHQSTARFDEATRVEIRGGDIHDAVDITMQREPRFSVSVPS